MNKKERDYYEIANSNGNYNEDDVLIGLLGLALAILKHQQAHFKYEKNNQIEAINIGLMNQPCPAFINELFHYLFKINDNNELTFCGKGPHSSKLPKCRAVQSRALCFDLLIELCRSNQENYKYLNQMLIDLNRTLSITVSPFSGSASTIIFF